MIKIYGGMVLKRLGVIGGLGPLATAYFMELIVRMTDARTDQEHLEMVILNRPSIPDRTSYILDHTRESPLIPMIESGKELIGMGADILAVPCVTAHFFLKELQRELPVPVIHLIHEMGVLLQLGNVSKVGILATDGTIQSGLFQREFRKLGISCVIPNQRSQGMVMDIIYNHIKAGKPIPTKSIQKIVKELTDRGAVRIVLGCTELSLMKREYGQTPLYIDALEVLAAHSLRQCDAPLTKEAASLFMKHGKSKVI